MRYLVLDKLINLHDGYRRRIKIDQLDLLLLQEEGRVHIVDSRCPHQAFSLERADVDGGVIYCPMHGYGFSLKDGHHDDGLCAALRVYEPIYDGPSIGIMVPSEP